MDDTDDRPVERRTISRRRFGVLAGGTALIAASAGSVLATALNGGGERAAGPDAPTPTGTPPASTASPTVSTPAPTAQPTPTPEPARPTLSDENLEPGDPDWLPTRGNVGSVAGFASPRSVTAGETIRFHVAAVASTATVRIYRVGWYGGAGARLLTTEEAISCAPFSYHLDELRMVHPDWGASMELAIPAHWTTGVHVARVDSADGLQHLIPFWVKSPARKSPVLVLSGLATYAAYSAWGGYSLYANDSSDGLRAHAVSLDRPFNRNWGAGDLLTWEYQFIRWFEHAGYDADYACDIDLDARDDLLNGRRLIVLPGHQEYYTDAMREALEVAVAAGTNMAVLGANALYWRVRLSDSELGTRRNVVCYKDAGLDPDAHGVAPTIRFRDGPNARPEAAFLGVQYEQTNSFTAPWKVYDPGHWAFEGTGLVEGDEIPGLIGPEYDRVVPGISPPTTEVLTQSPVTNDYGEAALSHSTIVEYPSGASVFDSGTLHFSFALDTYRIPRWLGVGTEDERVKRFLANIIDRFTA